MSDTPTPGQVAYETFRQAFTAAFGIHGDQPWSAIHPGIHRCWEAAAEAAITAWIADPDWPMPENAQEDTP